MECRHCRRGDHHLCLRSRCDCDFVVHRSPADALAAATARRPRASVSAPAEAPPRVLVDDDTGPVSDRPRRRPAGPRARKPKARTRPTAAPAPAPPAPPAVETPEKPAGPPPVADRRPAPSPAAGGRPGTVHVALVTGGPSVSQPPGTLPGPRLTYRARQDPARRVWPGRMHPRLRAARAERRQWRELVDAADRLLAANRWSPASKRLVAEVLGDEMATWLDPPA